jgi:MFS family permease
MSGDDHEGWIDSRYAWIAIVPSTFSVALAVMGVQYSAGVVNSAVLLEFKESEGLSAWVTAIAIGVLLLAMGPGGTLQAYIGFRFTIIIGGVLTVVGLISSAFVTHIWHLYITYGLIAGTGQGFAYLGAVSATQVWFSPKHRAMAMAVASAGSGFGTIILGTVTEKLIRDHSWKTGFYFCTAISAVFILLPAIFLGSPPAAPTAIKEKPKPPPFMDVVLAPGLPYFMLCLFVFGFGGWNPIVHNVELYTQHNFDATEAANLISIGFGVGSVRKPFLSLN